MPGLIGKKIGMTSLFDESGKNVPCTVLEASPNVVTQIKTQEVDGYNAVQLGYDDKKEKNTPAALRGHFKKAKTAPKHKLVEFDRFEDEVSVGDAVDLSIFEEGRFVHVTGTSKGKGFQGVVKRHNFRGVGDQTHGQHNRGRAPGSIGAASYPARVFKGMRMAGQMGNERVNVQNLQVMKILSERNLILVKGAVPGHRGSYVIIER